MSAARGTLVLVTPTATPAAPTLTRWVLVARLATSVLAIATAGAGWAAWTQPGSSAPRVVTLVAAVVTACLAFVVWVLEERTAAELRGAARSLEDLLQAERIRIATVTNGAFLSTLAALQDLAGLDADERRTTISGFRQKVVERACDLVTDDQPRAAYFRVDDLTAPLRVMSPRGAIAQRSRTDEFTTEFDEASGTEPGVWHLVDEGDRALLREEVDLPGKAYRSYISAPVRAGGIPFGMLTLNVLEPGGLSEEDRDFVLVLARLLAVAESLALPRAQRAAAARTALARSTLDGTGPDEPRHDHEEA